MQEAADRATWLRRRERRNRELRTGFRLGLLVFLAILLALLTDTRAKEPPAVTLVEWSSEESATRFPRSTLKVDFFPLANHFVSQDNKIFCGPVSAAIVLNALRLGRKDGLPEDRRSIHTRERAWLPADFNPFFGKYTPNNVFTGSTKRKIEVLGKPIEIEGRMRADYGLQLRQLAQMLRAHGLSVEVRVVDEQAKPEDVLNEIAINLGTRDDYVLVNYSRKALGQKGGGHISPVGAYDWASDSYLVMDVNPNRAPWVWIEGDDLVAAMRTFDTVENRGYLLIAESE